MRHPLLFYLWVFGAILRSVCVTVPTPIFIRYGAIHSLGYIKLITIQGVPFKLYQKCSKNVTYHVTPNNF